MKNQKPILILMIVFCITIPAFTQGNLGQSGANFLQINVDPRGAALGGAFTALAEGASALYWNPAGAINAKNMDINLSHTNWFLDTKLMYVGLVKNFDSIGSFGFSITSFYMDEMEITTPYESEGTNQFYDAGDISVGVSYARSLTDRFTFGVTAKYVREYIWNESASQVAMDVGSLYQTDFYNLRIGMVIRNFAGKLQFEGDDIDSRIDEEINRDLDNNPRIERLTPEFRLPQVFQMGIAFDPLENETNRLTMLADVIVPSDNREYVAVGMEYGFRKFAFLRSGYRFDYDSGDFSFGGGLNLKTIGMNARIDYAYSSQGVLGSVHRFGIGMAL